jgi:hypothetical protein
MTARPAGGPRGARRATERVAGTGPLLTRRPLLSPSARSIVASGAKCDRGGHAAAACVGSRGATIRNGSATRVRRHAALTRAHREQIAAPRCPRPRTCATASTIPRSAEASGPTTAIAAARRRVGSLWARSCRSSNWGVSSAAPRCLLRFERRPVRSAAKTLESSRTQSSHGGHGPASRSSSDPEEPTPADAPYSLPPPGLLGAS